MKNWNYRGSASKRARAGLLCAALVCLAVPLALLFSRGVDEPAVDPDRGRAALLPIRADSFAGQDVLFVGDSLTSGYFASEATRSYKSIVLAELPGAVPVEAAMADQDLTTVSRIVGVPDNLRLAVIELGTNDITVGTDIVAFSKEYSALLQRIVESSPGAGIVCVGTWSAGTNNYDVVIQNACAVAGGRFVAINSIYKDPSNRGPAGQETAFGVSDDFHPNDRGHEAIASRILDAALIKS